MSMGFFSEMFDELDRFIVCHCSSNQRRPSQHGPRSSSLLLLAAGPTYLRAACQQSSHVCACRPRAQDDAAGRRLGNGAKFYGKRRSSSLLARSQRAPQLCRMPGARALASCGVRT